MERKKGQLEKVLPLQTYALLLMLLDINALLKPYVSCHEFIMNFMHVSLSQTAYFHAQERGTS